MFSLTVRYRLSNLDRFVMFYLLFFQRLELMILTLSLQFDLVFLFFILFLRFQ
jgi:hypothetical protein